jgi:hypothetical protein
MKMPAIKPYRCLCEECEPLAPIEGLQAPPQAQTEPTAGNLFKCVAQRLLSARPASSP